MHSYIGLFKMTFKGELQYRAKALSGMATQFFWGLMYVYLYTAFMGGRVIEGFSISQMATYVWLGQALFAMRCIGMPKHSAGDIETGNVCYKFVRPVGIYDQWFAEYLGEKVSCTLLRCLPITIIAFILPNNIGMSLPDGFAAFVVFLLGVCLSFAMVVAFSMFAVYLSFKTMSAKGAQAIVMVVVGLFGGMYVPIPLMPLGLQKVLNYLPFRFVSDLPFRVYIGNISPLQGLIAIAIGVVWLAVLILLGKLLIKSALKNVVVQGG